MRRVTINGVGIDGVTAEEAAEQALMPRKETCVAVTPNALMLQNCKKDPAFAALLNRATLSLPDGAGVLLAAKKLGTPLPCRVAGIEFGERLMKRAAELGLRVFLLGGKDGVAARAAERLTDQIQGLTVCGTHHGYFDKTGVENDRVIALIQNAAPDLLFVCFGSPMQEEWIFQNRPMLPSVRVIAGLGGSLDVWSGKLRRAPAPLRAMRLEWAWRMLREPKRLRQLPALVRFYFGRHDK